SAMCCTPEIRVNGVVASDQMSAHFPSIIAINLGTQRWPNQQVTLPITIGPRRRILLSATGHARLDAAIDRLPVELPGLRLCSVELKSCCWHRLMAGRLPLLVEDYAHENARSQTRKPSCGQYLTSATLTADGHAR